MAIDHASSGTVIDLNTYRENTTSALVKTDHFETILMFIEAGKTIPAHSVDGPITVQCLNGKCTFTVGNEKLAVEPGAWFYLEGGAEHGIDAQQDTSLLVTIVFVNQHA
jgi:quercetin dioxygenase-like cupin family protein